MIETDCVMPEQAWEIIESDVVQTVGKPKAPRRRPRQPAPYVPRGQLLVLPTGRTGQGRRLREFRQELIKHVGGSPSATQMALIDRATVLQNHLTTMDRKAAQADGVMSESAGKQYLAWSNTLTRTLKVLGLEAPAAKPPTLQQYIDAMDDDEDG